MVNVPKLWRGRKTFGNHIIVKFYNTYYLFYILQIQHHLHKNKPLTQHTHNTHITHTQTHPHPHTFTLLIHHTEIHIHIWVHQLPRLLRVWCPLWNSWRHTCTLLHTQIHAHLTIIPDTPHTTQPNTLRPHISHINTPFNFILQMFCYYI